MGVHIRLYNAQGDVIAFLPDVVGVQAGDVDNDVSAVTVTYAVGGVNADFFDHGSQPVVYEQRIASVVIDGEERIWFLIEEDEWDDDGVESTFTFGGRDTGALLDKARVYPSSIGSLPASVTITGTAGLILDDLHTLAQARGAIPRVTITTFDALVDSDGNPWAQSKTLTFEAGWTLRDAAQLLVEQGMLAWRMVGTDLRAYQPVVPGFQAPTAIDYGVTRDTFVLRPGRDIYQVRRSRSRREQATTILGVADDGLTVSRTAALSEALYGRVEGAESGGANPAELTALLDRALDKRQIPTVSVTCRAKMDEVDARRLWTDYMVGDVLWLGRPSGAPNEQRKLTSAAVVIDSSGLVSAEYEFGPAYDALLATIGRDHTGAVGTWSRRRKANAVPTTIAPRTATVTDGIRLLGPVRQDVSSAPVRARIQTGLVTDAGSRVTVNFPVAFPNGVTVTVTANTFGPGGTARVVDIESVTATGFVASIGTGAGGVGSGVTVGLMYIAVGTVG